MKKSFAPLFIFVLLAIVSCGSPRYASSVVTTKVSDIPEFAFLKPCAYMVLYDTDGGYYNQDNTDIATDVITNIISSERFHFTDVMEADYQGEDKDVVDWAKNLMEKVLR